MSCDLDCLDLLSSIVPSNSVYQNRSNDASLLSFHELAKVYSIVNIVRFCNV